MNACPCCVGKITADSPAFFEEETLTPTHDTTEVASSETPTLTQE
jgi:hypothetical protein